MTDERKPLAPDRPEKKPDVRTDLVSDEEYERNCELYADWGLFTAPEKFLFHHYDERPDKVLVCRRPMLGLEKYVVEGINGGFYGIYDTRDVNKYLKTGTWIEIESTGFFERVEIEEMEHSLAQKKAEYDELIASAAEGK